MAKVCVRITDEGPLLKAYFSPSPALKNAHEREGNAYSDRVVHAALIDTGASYSLVDNSIVESLCLPMVDDAIEVRDFQGKPSFLKGYGSLQIDLHDDESRSSGFSFKVVGANFSQEEFKAIIGRDVLRTYRFIYDGIKGEACIEYDYGVDPHDCN